MQSSVEEEKRPTKVTVRGCSVLRHDLTAIASQLTLALEYRFLPGSLHNQPDELRPVYNRPSISPRTSLIAAGSWLVIAFMPNSV